jgi:hypothetical protein
VEKGDVWYVWLRAILWTRKLARTTFLNTEEAVLDHTSIAAVSVLEAVLDVP